MDWEIWLSRHDLSRSPNDAVQTLQSVTKGNVLKQDIHKIPFDKRLGIHSNTFLSNSFARISVVTGNLQN